MDNVEFPAIYKAIGFQVDSADTIAGDYPGRPGYFSKDEVYKLGVSKYRKRFENAEPELAKLSDEDLKEVALNDSSEKISEETEFLLADLAEFI